MAINYNVKVNTPNPVKVVVFGLLAVVIVAAICSFLYGWILMLLLGVLHNNFSTAVPAAGYWSCIIPAFLFRILIAQTTSSNS